MNNAPSREHLKSLLVSIHDEQRRLMARCGMSRGQNAFFSVKLEPLKTPIFVLWDCMDYGDFPQSREQHQWLASFKASPPDFLSECIMLVKTCDLPIDDLAMRRQLIGFYSDLNKSFEL
jgi:hypothetical protein